MSAFDGALLERHPGLVRYADDFLVCCKTNEECQQVHELVKARLAPLKLRLHDTKTHPCVEANTGVNFLGFCVSTRGVRVRDRNVVKFKTRIQGVLKTQKVYSTAPRTLRVLAHRVAYKIRGPSDQQLKMLAERGSVVAQCRRSWIGFFRIVDDMTQIGSLDRWIRKQVSAFIWKQHKERVRLKHMQAAGLPSLINSLWKARSQQPPPE